MLKDIRDSRQHLWRTFSLIAITFAIGGCTFATNYNQTYVPNEKVQKFEPVSGKVFIYTDKSDDNYVFSGKPTSLLGAVHTLTIPLGAMTTGIAGTVFGRMFTDGFDSSNSLENISQYRVVIKPKVSNFTYEYNGLKT